MLVRLCFCVSAVLKIKTNNNKIFYPSSSLISTASAGTCGPRPGFLICGLYLQYSILNIDLNFFSPLICLLLLLILRERSGN
jgi:hypothetical protein